MKQLDSFRIAAVGLTMALCATGMSAQQFTREEITYSLVSRDDKTCEIVSVSADCPATLVIPDSIQFGGINYGVIGIGQNAFDLAVNLATLTFPTHLKYIESAAFFKTTKLRNITCLSTTPPDITSSPFATTIYTNGTLTVPAGCWLPYCLDWRRFHRIIEPGSKEVIIDGKKYRLFSPTSGYAAILGNGYKDTEFVIPEKIEYDGKEFTIVEIGSYAFDACADLASVTIPKTVVGLNDYCFRKCNSLKSITLPDSLLFIHQGAFNNNTAIESIVIPEKVDRLENVVFQNATALKTIKVPDAVYYIGSSCLAGATALTDFIGGKNLVEIMSAAFNGASSLTGFTFSDKVYQIENMAFKGTGITFTEFPKNVTILNSSTFYGCYNLKNVVVGDQVTTIGANAFTDCAALETIQIPDSLSALGNNVFGGCNNLKKVNIPTKGLKSLANYLFDKCYGLVEMEVPEGYVTLSNAVFQNCTGLKKVKLPSTLTGIAINNFYNCSSLEEINIPDSVKAIGYRVFTGCASLKSIKLPDGVVELGTGLFANCKELTNVEISPKLIGIYNQAFQNCKKLEHFNMPPTVKEIKNLAFDSCVNLKEIVIPDSCTTIGTKAFKGCLSLTSVIAQPNTPPTIVDDTFDTVVYENATLSVPEGTLEAYREATGWKLFKKGQVGVEEISIDAEEADIRGGYGEIIAPEGALIYTLQGVSAPKTGLTPGLYIVRAADKVKKVIVK